MLQIENLKVVFNEGTVNEKKALDNLSLHLQEGDFLTVIGGNGAGKSTLLNSILGLVDASGNIFLDSEKIDGLPSYKRAKNIGVVYQNPLMGTAPNMTIKENLSLVSAKGKWNLFSSSYRKKNNDSLKNDLLSLDLGLECRLDSNVGLLSGGERQALTLLMATKETPKLLLLDEHTAALDPKTANKILKLTNDIVTKKNITTIMITHNIKDALEYGNKLIMMSQGKIILSLSGEEKKNMTTQKVLDLYNYSLSDRQILNV